MKIFERYFERNTGVYLPCFSNDPQVIVIIPVFNDPDIFATVDSLCECHCRRGDVGVIVVVNHSEGCAEEIKKANFLLAEKLRLYTAKKQQEKPCLSFVVLEAFDLPRKFAGVGLARKIAMDAAARYFYGCKTFYQPILSLDADTLVEKNYTDEVLRFFGDHSVAGVSIAYAHRLETCGGEVRKAMIKYELYLRYYQLALKLTGHPYAYPCIGSAFAVRTADYVAEGGMNKRQAGEDFYFLQKLIATGRYALLKTTRVYPSARFSARTPFGTGQSVQGIVENGGQYPVYGLEAFQVLKDFFGDINVLYKADRRKIEKYFALQSPVLQSFLQEMSAVDLMMEVNANCASIEQFKKRFFDRFNAFRVLKFLNYAHETSCDKKEISEAVKALFTELGYAYSTQDIRNLEFLRKNF